LCDELAYGGIVVQSQHVGGNRRIGRHGGIVPQAARGLLSTAEGRRAAFGRRSATERARAVSRETRGVAMDSLTHAPRTPATSAGWTKPIISTTGMSGRIARISRASSEPVMSGMVSSDSTALKRSGAARNAASAAALEVNPTGS